MVCGSDEPLERDIDDFIELSYGVNNFNLVLAFLIRWFDSNGFGMLTRPAQLMRTLVRGRLSHMMHKQLSHIRKRVERHWLND